MMRVRPTFRHRGAWFAAETVIALTVVTILAAALAAAMTQHRRASQQLAESRADVRLAEQILAAMQSGEPPPAAPAGVNISVRRLDVPGDVTGSCAWASVRVTRSGRISELLGLVRADALKGAAP